MTTVIAEAQQTKVAVKVMGKECLKNKASATSENRRTGCERDMLGQTVLSMGSGNREGPITNTTHATFENQKV